LSKFARVRSIIRCSAITQHRRYKWIIDPPCIQPPPSFNVKKSILAAFTALALLACSDSGTGYNNAGSDLNSIKKEKIYGVAQKGPFVNGDVVIYELDDKYEKTNKSFRGKTDGKGYFEIEINGELASPYVIIEAKGKYSNEVSGKTTSDAITLKAVADISNKDNVNVNVLTDLETDKVIKLAQQGISFDYAKTYAQREVFTALGISEVGLTRNSEDMALFGGNSSDSVLLVVSVSLQGNRTEAEVSSLLADLGGSGKFDVANGLANVDLSKVKSNIQALEPSAVVPNIPGTAPKTIIGKRVGEQFHFAVGKAMMLELKFAQMTRWKKQICSEMHVTAKYINP